MPGPQMFGTVVLLSTVILFVVCFVLYAILQRKRHMRCPKCGKRFKVSAAQSFFAARDGVDKRMHCPNCGYFGYLEDCRDEEALEDADLQGADDAQTDGTFAETDEEETSASDTEGRDGVK